MASLNQNGHFKNVQNEIPQNSFEIHYYQKGGSLHYALRNIMIIIYVTDKNNIYYAPNHLGTFSVIIVK